MLEIDDVVVRLNTISFQLHSDKEKVGVWLKSLNIDDEVIVSGYGQTMRSTVSSISIDDGEFTVVGWELPTIPGIYKLKINNGVRIGNVGVPITPWMTVTGDGVRLEGVEVGGGLVELSIFARAYIQDGVNKTDIYLLPKNK